LSALAEEGDKNTICGKHLLAPTGDPLTWKFDKRTPKLLDALHATFKPEENLAARNIEHFCICNGPDDDGLPMMEYCNDRVCFLKWVHLGSDGMEIDESPWRARFVIIFSTLKITNTLSEDWFCEHGAASAATNPPTNDSFKNQVPMMVALRFVTH
jgi:hypothetical protein